MDKDTKSLCRAMWKFYWSDNGRIYPLTTIVGGVIWAINLFRGTLDASERLITRFNGECILIQSVVTIFLVYHYANKKLRKKLQERVSELEGKRTGLRICIERDLDINSGYFFRGRISNKGDTVDEVHIKIARITHDGELNSKYKDMELCWTGQIHGPRNLHDGADEIFDIMTISRGGAWVPATAPPRAYYVGWLGKEPKMYHAKKGRHGFDIQVYGKDIEMILIHVEINLNPDLGTSAIEILQGNRC